MTGIGLKRSVDEALETAEIKDATVADSMCKYLVSSKSEGTVKKYFNYFKKWKEFCSENKYNSLPAQPIHIAIYLTKLLDKKVSFSVISASAYSIKWAHKLCGKSDPTENGYVINLLEASKRLRSKKVIKKDVVTSDMLKELCILYDGCTDILHIRDLCMILIGYAGFLRYDEISKIKCCNIKIFENYFSLHIDSSKTDRYRAGAEILISKGDTVACPFQMLLKYISLAKIDLLTDEYLFKPMFRSGKKCSFIHKNKPLSYTRAKECILAKLKAINPNLNLGLHSLRAGGVTTAANAGINDRCLKRHGRWKSDSSKDGYIEDSFESRIEITKTLGL